MMSPEELASMRDGIRYLQDRQAILDCLVRECRGRDRHDSELVASCYWDDATVEAGKIISAQEYPAAQNRGHANAFVRTAHNITNHTCEIDGDVAYSEAYCIGAFLTTDRTSCRFVAARYLDQFERRNGEWRIAQRRNSIEMSSDGDPFWAQSGILSGFLHGMWSRDDPSYHRPLGPRENDARW